jgi:hypothetical protein
MDDINKANELTNRILDSFNYEPMTPDDVGSGSNGTAVASAEVK